MSTPERPDRRRDQVTATIYAQTSAWLAEMQLIERKLILNGHQDAPLSSYADIIEQCVGAELRRLQSEATRNAKIVPATSKERT
jgi:hypothetical protein